MHSDESPAAELWRRTLSQIQCVFGRLVYLASLRDPNTGTYVHYGFAQRFNSREADLTLRRSHRNIFADWLCFTIEEQVRDVEVYLASLDSDRKEVLAAWVRLPPFANFLPADVKEVERELFLADMRVNLSVLNKGNSR